MHLAKKPICMDDILLSDVDFVAFDLETTGLDPAACRIVEFGAVRFRLDGAESARYAQLVDPGCRIPWQVVRIHGITTAMVRGKPTVAEALPGFLDFLGADQTVLLAHNARFDLEFLRVALAETGLPLLPHAVVDTLDLARTCIPGLPSHRLEYVAWRLRIADREDHRALSDARLVVAAFRRMLARRPGLRRLGDLFWLSPPLRMTESPTPGAGRTARRRGVVAVIVEQGRFLVIRRAQSVVAPGKYCFPGGAIEPGESEEVALIREIHEELGTGVRPLRRLWQSVTPWGVPLAWWLGEIDGGSRPVPNPSEVESVHWLTPDEMAAEPDLLESNRRFLQAVAAGEIDLYSSRSA